VGAYRVYVTKTLISSSFSLSIIEHRDQAAAALDSTDGERTPLLKTSLLKSNATSIPDSYTQPSNGHLKSGLAGSPSMNTIGEHRAHNTTVETSGTNAS
jgi:hypothetical protein